MKKILILIISAMFLFGCNTIVAEFAVVNEVKENSIVIVNSIGNTTEIVISPDNDFTFEVNKEYFFKYEIINSKKTVLISVESNGD